jgi:DNA-binding NtrC family response regulator
MGEAPPERTITFQLPPHDPRQLRRSLIIAGPRVMRTFALPARGELVIGRGEEADLALEDASVSRRHVRLAIDEAGVTAEELGSANGTTIAGISLLPGAPHRLDEGASLQIGEFLLVLQVLRRAPVLGHLWPHESTLMRLAEECRRALSTRQALAVLVLHVEGADRDARDAAVLRATPETGTAGCLGDDHAMIARVASRLDAAELGVRVTATIAGLGLRVRSGLAVLPDDGGSPDALIDRARQVLAGGASERDTAIVVDPKMRQVHALAVRAASSDLTVLLLGETGTGKEVLAEAVHRASPRASRPYVRLNCGAFSETLLESELFGHEKGAFTGATHAKPGLLESADGGTVLLDEIGEMPAALQVKLLRVLESGESQRVGGLQPRRLDVRFVCATHRDLEAEIAHGRFREDLYYRISTFTLVIPPLRERRAEIMPLAHAFAQRRDPRTQFESDAIAMLEAYAWPGNVRELRNVVDRAAVLADDGRITAACLPDKLRARAAPSAPAAGEPPSLLAEIAELEKKRIVEALDRCAGNQTRAAEALGITRRQLLLRIEALDLPRPRKK